MAFAFFFQLDVNETEIRYQLRSHNVRLDSTQSQALFCRLFLHSERETRICAFYFIFRLYTLKNISVQGNPTAQINFLPWQMTKLQYCLSFKYI